MSQITLLIGPNGYAIAQERLRWASEFKKRQGEDSLLQLDAKQTTFKELQNECQIAPFLAEKRLIIVHGVPSRGTKEDVQQLPKLIHPQALVLFTLQTEPGKKPKLTIPAKALQDIATVKQFPVLSSGELMRWAQMEVQKSGATQIQPAALQRLLQLVGEDQALLATEIVKLGTYAHNRVIETHDVEVLATASAEQNVWQLMDYLGAGKIADTIRFTNQLLDSGYSPQALWSMLVWMITVLTHIVAVVEAGETNPWKIAGIVRANPSGVKAVLPLARSLSKSKLQYIVRTALDADLGMKTGVYKATNDAPEEVMALIDRSICSFSS